MKFFSKIRDSLPYIGAYPGTPNGFYALGFGGKGITFNIIAAELVTQSSTG